MLCVVSMRMRAQNCVFCVGVFFFVGFRSGRSAGCSFELLLDGLEEMPSLEEQLLCPNSCVCVRERDREYVCVRERERERARARERERESQNQDAT